MSNQNKNSRNRSSKTRKLVVVAMLSAISIFLGLTGLGFITIPPVKATIMHIPVIIGAIIEGPLVGALIGLVFGLFSMYQAFAAPLPTSFIFWNPIIAILPRILIGIASYYIYVITLKSCKKNLKATSIIGGLIIGILGFLAGTSLSKMFNLNSLISHIIGVVLGIVLFGLVIFIVAKIKDKNKEEILAIGVSAVLGTMVNTVGVLGLTYIIYLDKYAQELHMSSQMAGASIIALGVSNGIPEAFISAIITVPVILAVKKIRK